MNNFLRLIKSEKSINLFCYIFCGIYLLFAFCYIFVDYSNNLKFNATFNSLNSYIEATNSKLEENNFYNYKPLDVPQAEVFFHSGEEALLFAYSNFYNSNSFYMQGFGDWTVSSPFLGGTEIKLYYQNTSVKFSNGNIYNEILVKDKKITAISYATKLIKEVCCFGISSYYEVYQSNEIFTKDVVNEKDFLVGNYKNCVKNNNYTAPLMANALPVINNNTITKITYYKAKTKNNIPIMYYVQAELDPDLASKFFKTNFELNANGIHFNNLVHNSFTFTASIDVYGNLKGFIISGTGKLKAQFGIDLNCDTTYSISFSVNNINQQKNFTPEGF